MIFIKYCSSDSWFGDAGASAATFNFSFRGARIVSAAVTALVSAHGLGASGRPERLLFAGCSAGGRGVLTNLDSVAAAVPSNVQVQGLLDAAAWVDVQPIIPGML
jgi:acetyl esterase/lipase